MFFWQTLELRNSTIQGILCPMTLSCYKSRSQAHKGVPVQRKIKRGRLQNGQKKYLNTNKEAIQSIYIVFLLRGLPTWDQISTYLLRRLFEVSSGIQHIGLYRLVHKH